MHVKKLIEELKKFDDYDVVVCMDENGGWDNIEHVDSDGTDVIIVFGGGSPFTDEK